MIIARTNRGVVNQFDDETGLCMYSRSCDASEPVESHTRLSRSARGESQSDHVSGDVQFQLDNGGVDEVAHVSIRGDAYDHRLTAAAGDKHRNGGHLACNQVRGSMVDT